MPIRLVQTLFAVLGIGLLVSCASSPAGKMGLEERSTLPPPAQTSLPDLGPAPELTNTVWLNTSAPLRLNDLRGKVVLLDMWTFECINCQHVIPALKDWHNRFQDKGLVIIGNHYPEFEAEKSLDNLRKAVADQGILYPVAQDNDGVTWNSYHNQYWPTFYLIDKRGELRYTHIGEGSYDETEKAIQSLLAESYSE
jgi:thiol-disulfide isomerase/thioredoxin